MYYWDGATWISTLSPDGRYRWDGAAWRPVAWSPAMPYPGAPQVQRQPTSWTRPLQYAVAGWYAISALVSLSLPFWMGGMMSQMMNAAFQRQAQQNPGLEPPPQSFYDGINSMMTGAVWIAAIVAFAIALLVIIGALRRWIWLYYVLLVFLGLGVVSAPVNLLQFATGSFSNAYGYSPPAWLYLVGIVSWIPSTILFVAMIVALARRGPWGMTKVTPGGSPAA